MRVRATIFAVKNNNYFIFWVYACNLSYSGCNASYFHLWSAWLYNIFPHCLVNGTILGKKSYWI